MSEIGFSEVLSLAQNNWDSRNNGPGIVFLRDKYKVFRQADRLDDVNEK